MITGLNYLPNWIDSEIESKLLEKIEDGVWETFLQRRVQQFGPVYNYQNRKLNDSRKDIPEWIKQLVYPGLMKFFDKEPNQIIINEYEIRQGITKHVDAPVFGLTTALLSLLSDTDMVFGQYKGAETKQLLNRRRRSLIVMSSEARSKWYHYIPPVTHKRISITFRTT